MANRNFDPVRGHGKELVLIRGRVAIGAVGAVGAKTGRGFSVTRSGAGVYAVALDDAYPAILEASAGLSQALASSPRYLKIERTTTGMTVRCYDLPPSTAAAYQGVLEPIVAPAAGGTNVLAQQSDDFDLAVGFVQPDALRNLQVTFGASWPADVPIVVESTRMGTTQSESFAANPGGVTVGSLAHGVITRIYSNGPGGPGADDVTPGAGVTADVQLAAAAQTGFGAVTWPVTAFRKLVAGGTHEAFASSTAATGTWKPTTPPNGAIDYAVYYNIQTAVAAALADPVSGDSLEVRFVCSNSSVTP